MFLDLIERSCKSAELTKSTIVINALVHQFNFSNEININNFPKISNLLFFLVTEMTVTPSKESLRNVINLIEDVFVVLSASTPQKLLKCSSLIGEFFHFLNLTLEMKDLIGLKMKILQQILNLCGKYPYQNIILQLMFQCGSISSICSFFGSHLSWIILQDENGNGKLSARELDNAKAKSELEFTGSQSIISTICAVLNLTASQRVLKANSLESVAASLLTQIKKTRVHFEILQHLSRVKEVWRKDCRLSLVTLINFVDLANCNLKNEKIPKTRTGLLKRSREMNLIFDLTKAECWDLIVKCLTNSSICVESRETWFFRNGILRILLETLKWAVNLQQLISTLETKSLTNMLLKDSKFEKLQEQGQMFYYIILLGSSNKLFRDEYLAQVLKHKNEHHNISFLEKMDKLPCKTELFLTTESNSKYRETFEAFSVVSSTEGLDTFSLNVKVLKNWTTSKDYFSKQCSKVLYKIRTSATNYTKAQKHEMIELLKTSLEKYTLQDLNSGTILSQASNMLEIFLFLKSSFTEEIQQQSFYFPVLFQKQKEMKINITSKRDLTDWYIKTRLKGDLTVLEKFNFRVLQLLF